MEINIDQGPKGAPERWSRRQSFASPLLVLRQDWIAGRKISLAEAFDSCRQQGHRKSARKCLGTATMGDIMSPSFADTPD